MPAPSQGDARDADLERRGGFKLEVRTDAPSLTQDLVADLKTRGFTQIKQTTIAAAEAGVSMIALQPGALAANEIDVAEVLVSLDHFVRAQAIDHVRYPVQRLETEGSSPIITLPIGSCATGVRPSYAGSGPDRFVVRIESDDRARSQRIVDTLRDKGVRAIRRAIRSDRTGFWISCPKGPDAIAFIEPIRRAVEAAIRDVAGDDEAEYGIDLFDAETDEVTAALPLAALASGKLMEKLAAPERFACTIYAADPDSRAAADVRRRLASLGWRDLSIKRTDQKHGATIAYGGAPTCLMKRVQGLVEETLPGRKPRLEQRWSKHDTDVWIYVPSDLASVAVASGPEAATATEDATAVPTIERAFVEVRDDHVAIGRHVLPRRPRHELAPDPALFARYVVDQSTAENLDHIAISMLAAEPCLIEGPTATSKTSAMMFAASLMGQGVIRLNLNGQTDTSELIGRYVPGSGGWQWSPGAVPRAMREGLWLVLDELNLCEPAVIERLNSVLESSPSLYLGESDGRIIGGSGGDPTHPDFRVLASLNPVEGHVGRSPLSPALRDRFVGFRRARRADASDIGAQLRFLFHGTEPIVVVDGVRYAGSGPSRRPPYADLARDLPDLELLIAAFARFHVGAEAACVAHGGAGDRPVITRRSLLACIEYLDAYRSAAMQSWATTLWSAIERYYLARAFDPTQHAALVALATATGIGQDRWSFS